MLHRAVVRVAIAAIIAPGAPVRAQSKSPDPVAIVSSLSGKAWVSLPGGKRELKAFDWLLAASRVEVAPGGSLVLAFASGSRHEMSAGAAATIEANGPVKPSGTIRSLSAVPPLPRVSALAVGVGVGPRTGAIRIRGANDLYPSRGASTLPDETVLRVSPLAAGTRYAYELEDEMGVKVFQVETDSPAVQVPAGVLKPGGSYYWRVRAGEAGSSVVRGEAVFATVGSEPLRARAALKAAADTAGDAASLALVAAIDRALGLLLEAREGFRLALAKSPEDATLRLALEGVEQQLRGGEAEQ